MNKLKNPLIIVANGEFPTHHTPLEKIKEATSILACDGGTDTLIENGYTPNLIIGDLDSISEDKKKKFKNIIIENNNQSNNDLRKAIDYAGKNDINNIHNFDLNEFLKFFKKWYNEKEANKLRKGSTNINSLKLS